MSFIKYLEYVIYKYFLTLCITVLLIFKRRIPKVMQERFRDILEELRYTPPVKKDTRY